MYAICMRALSTHWKSHDRDRISLTLLLKDTYRNRTDPESKYCHAAAACLQFSEAALLRSSLGRSFRSVPHCVPFVRSPLRLARFYGGGREALGERGREREREGRAKKSNVLMAAVDEGNSGRPERKKEQCRDRNERERERETV